MKSIAVILRICAIATISAHLLGSPSTVTVHPSERRQSIQGFGCSINGWTADVIPLYYQSGLADYAANELGMSVFRVQIWGGVSPREVEDWQDISYRDFQWKSHGMRGKVNVDWAKAMVAANPEVKIIGSVWSPPAWMKTNGSMEGTAAGGLLDPGRDYDDDNRLRDDRYEHFAKWVVEWARYMESQGTPFYAISLQNELFFTQWYESAMYTPDEYARIVRLAGEMFESEGVRKPLFYGPEDMTLTTYEDEVRHKPYVDALMKPEVSKYFDVFATHGYTDGVRADAKHNTVAYWKSIKQFGRPYWITEGGTGDHEWPAPLLAGIAPRLHVALVESNVSLFCGWLLSAPKGNDGTEHNFMAWDRPTKKTYAAMHYWRHIRPGSDRVEAEVSDDAEGLLVSAFRNDDSGTVVTVILNQADEVREVIVNWAGDSLEISDWAVFQTSGELNHEERLSVASDSESVWVNLPRLSITTVVGKARSD